MEVRSVVCWILIALEILLFARVILSWVGHLLPPALRPINSFIYNLTEPVLKPLRGQIPPLRIGMVALDLSILLVFVVLSIAIQGIC